jgi:peptide/nickel transport system substrate-binding protein
MTRSANGREARGFDSASSVAALRQGHVSRKEFILGGLAAGLSLTTIGGLLASCGAEESPQSSKPPSQPTGQIIFGNAEPPTSAYWDPASGFGLVDEQVASLVHDTLLGYDENENIVPKLATKWERTSPTKLRVQLREGVKFQDGASLTASDVKATLERLGAQDSELARSILFAPLHVEVIDDRTLDVVTEEPFGPLENSLAVTSILPTADIENPDNFKERALGCGPYRFVSYEDNKVTLEAYEDYWGDAPYIKTVVFNYIQDMNARTSALLSGQIDVMTRVSSEELDRVEDNDDFYVTKVGPPSQIVHIMQHNGPLGDLNVRQAVAYAVDRRAMAKSIMNGINPVAFSSLPSNTPGYEPVSPKYEFDPQKAKELLADSGQESGLSLSMATTTLLPHQLELDQVIAQYLKKIGIEVDTTRLEVGAFRSNYPQYDLSMNTLTSFNNDADFILGFYQGPTAEAVFHLNDPKIAPLVEAQRTAIGDARDEAITDCAQYLWNEQESLYISDEVWYFIVSSNIQNYKRAPLVGEPLLPKAWKAE